MFVDASALVAILVGEKDADSLAASLERASSKITSPIAIYETATAIDRLFAGGIGPALSRVRAFLENAGIDVVTIEDVTATKALEACARYGKGSGHPARLNMGDCFAYAMARQHGVPLLYKGDDFARTDLA